MGFPNHFLRSSKGRRLKIPRRKDCFVGSSGFALAVPVNSWLRTWRGVNACRLHRHGYLHIHMQPCIIYLPTCLSVYLSIYLSYLILSYLISPYLIVSHSFHRFIYLSIYLSICLSVCLSNPILSRPVLSICLIYLVSLTYRDMQSVMRIVSYRISSSL